MDINRLVQQAKKGDDASFEQLIAIVRTTLYRTAYAYVRNEQDALDIYQEAIYTAYSTIQKLKHPERFTSWIKKIVVFKAIDFIRKESRHFTTDDASLFEGLIAQEQEEEILHALDLSVAFNVLEPKVKAILLLRYYHDLSIKEIAHILKIPEGTIKSHINRAQKELRPILKEGYLL